MPRRGREGWKAGGHQSEVERAVDAELGRPLDGPRVAGEAPGLLGPAAQVGAGGRRQPTVHVVEAPPPAHGGHGSCQPGPGRPVVVDVVGSDDVGAGLARNFGQGVVAGRGEGLAVVPDLHRHVGPAKIALQACQFGPGRRWARTYKRLGDRSLAAARQHEPVAVSAGPRGARASRGSRRCLTWRWWRGPAWRRPR